jgi:hypothetical protein
VRRVQVVIGPDIYRLVRRLYAEANTLPSAVVIATMWAITLALTFLLGYGVCLFAILTVD